MQEGGTLLAWGSGAVLAIDNDLATGSLVGGASDNGDRGRGAEARVAEIEAQSTEDAPKPPAISPTADPDAPQALPGAVFRASLDLGHWLTFGYTDATLPVLVRGRSFFELSPHGANVAVFADDADLRLSGFVWPGNTERLLAGTAYAIVEPRGRGQVILLSQDPNYRLAWRSTGRLFANALLLGGTLR
jgi:hypothetical protein